MPLEVIVAVKQEDESFIHYSIYLPSLDEYDDPEQALTELSEAMSEEFPEAQTWGEVLEAACSDDGVLDDYHIGVRRTEPPAPYAIVNAGDSFYEGNLVMDLDITIDSPDLYDALYNELGAELRDELYTSMNGE